MMTKHYLHKRIESHCIYNTTSGIERTYGHSKIHSNTLSHFLYTSSSVVYSSGQQTSSE